MELKMEQNYLFSQGYAKRKTNSITILAKDSLEKKQDV